MRMKRKGLLLLLFISSWIVVAQTPDKELFQDAESRFRNKDYDLALERYDDLIREYPLSPYVSDSQFRRAVALYRTGKLEDSLSLFRRVELRYRSTRYLTFVPFWLGVVEYSTGDHKAAVTDLDRFLALEVETELVKQALLYKGMSEIALGMNSEAKATLSKLIEKTGNPGEQPSATVLLMSLRMRDGEYDEILKLNEALDLSVFDLNTRERVILFVAEALYAKGDSVRAKPLYESILTASPEIVTTVYQRLFLIAQNAGDAEESRKIVTQAEKTLAGKPAVLKEFWLRVGTQSYNQGKRDLAEFYFQRIWDLRGTEAISSTAPLYLAQIRSDAGDPLRALGILEEYLSSGQDSAEFVLLKLGELCILTENWSKADEYLARYLLGFPESESYNQGVYLRAYALYKGGKYPDSLSVIQKIFSQGKAGTYAGQLLKLKASVLQKQNKRDDAAQALREYMTVVPDNIASRMDLLKILFSEQKHLKVIEESEQLYKTFTDLEKTHPSDYLLARYLNGLSFVSVKRYSDAMKSLSGITEKRLQENGMKSLIPYNAFYRGWIMYRLGNNKDAISEFSLLLDKYPVPELSSRAAYLAGWCSFSIGQYESAEQYLTRLSTLSAPGDLKDKGAYLLGKSLMSRKRYQEAAITFQNIFLKSSGSAFADDALYEHAGILLQLGKTDDALRELSDLRIRYPESPLKQEAMYRRGEVLFNAERFKEARDAFYEYRSLFPKSNQFDAALYWGGLSSSKLGETYGASMLWEQIINDFKDSPFRPDALQRTAEVYAAKGEFRKALNLYTEMIAMYPKEARSVSAEQRSEELRYLLLGLSDREAELSVTIGREGGAKTEKGRKAILDLCRIYIFEGTARQDLAVSMLADVVQKKTEDPASAAHARYLTGEYYFRKGDPVQAATIFLEAATMNPQDKDLMAMSIYRSAEMMKLAGKNEDARQLVKRLEDNFPSSQWAVEGKKLVGDNR